MSGNYNVEVLQGESRNTGVIGRYTLVNRLASVQEYPL